MARTKRFRHGDRPNGYPNGYVWSDKPWKYFRCNAPKWYRKMLNQQWRAKTKREVRQYGEVRTRFARSAGWYW
jgi:hypothetical protein